MTVSLISTIFLESWATHKSKQTDMETEIKLLELNVYKQIRLAKYRVWHK